MNLTPELGILLGSTFVLSALWAAVLLVLVRVREAESAERPVARSHMGVELAWAVIPALLVLSVVLPTLQGEGRMADAGGDGPGIEVAEGQTGR